jgi:hypothetical protein
VTLEQVFDALAAAPEAEDLPRESEAIAVAIDHRRHDEVHHCVFCATRVRAQTVLYYHRSDLFPRPKWIDACWPHYSELHTLATTTWPTDAEVVAAFEAWEADR